MRRITTEEDGELANVAYHDGSLEGVVLENGGKRVKLLVRPTDGPRYTLLLEEVQALVISDFRQGNIISSIRFLQSQGSAPRPDLRHRVLERTYLDISNLGGEIGVFILEPVYGADMVAVCGSVFASDDDGAEPASHQSE